MNFNISIQRVLKLVTLCVCVLAFTDCGDTPQSVDDPMTDPALPTQPDNADVKRPASQRVFQRDLSDPRLIIDGKVIGLQAGEAIAAAPAGRLEAGSLESPKGKTEVYYIRYDKDEPIGYVLPDPNDKNKIGDIHITSSDLRLPSGLVVGTNLKKIKMIYPDVKLIESGNSDIIYADVGAYRFQLEPKKRRVNLDEGVGGTEQMVATELIIPRR